MAEEQNSTATTTTTATSTLSASPTSAAPKPLPTHDPTLKPSASILANPHEAPAPSSIKKPSALKAAFIPTVPGKLAKKKSGVQLGKSFRRGVPLDVKHQGGEVLQVDPRGEQASAGDGVVLPPISPGGASGDSNSGGASASSSALVTESDLDAVEDSISSSAPSSSGGRSRMGSIGSSRFADDNDDEDDDGISAASFSADGFPERGRGRQRTDTMSTADSSTSSSHSCAIRFAPLPVSGRLKRSTSITIGVAARSQMLQSQGQGRAGSGTNYYQLPPRAPGTASRGAAAAASAAQQRNRPQHPGADPSTSASAGSGNGGYRAGGPSQPNDVIDLGEELSKKARSAWKKMVGSSASNPKTSPTGAATTTASKGKPGEAATAVDSKDSLTVDAPMASKVGAAAGEKTPRRPASPVQPRSSVDGVHPSSPSESSQEAASAAAAAAATNSHPYSHLTQGSHQDHFPGVARHHLQHGHQGATGGTADEEGEGTQTPRAGMQRRLSTGAFLGGLSIRHMQEDRRREFGRDDDDDEGGEEVHTRPEEEGGQIGPLSEGHHQPDGSHPRSHLVTPLHNPEAEEDYVDASSSAASPSEDQDLAEAGEDEDEDVEGLREAQKLAQESSRRGARGAGVEVVHSSSSS